MNSSNSAISENIEKRPATPDGNLNHDLITYWKEKEQNSIFSIYKDKNDEEINVDMIHQPKQMNVEQMEWIPYEEMYIENNVVVSKRLSFGQMQKKCKITAVNTGYNAQVIKTINKENVNLGKKFRGFKQLKRKIDLNNLIKRKMMHMVDKVEIDELDATFFHRDEEKIWEDINGNGGWVHAKRFWAAVKFFNSTETGYKQEDICTFFGLTRDIIKKFMVNNKTKSILDFDGLSPVELNKNRNRYWKYFEKYASNYEQLIHEGVLKITK